MRSHLAALEYVDIEAMVQAAESRFEPDRAGADDGKAVARDVHAIL
jgi:hypothetical protein